MSVVEGTYISLARSVLFIQNKIKQLKEEENTFKRSCASSMQISKVFKFHFKDPDTGKTHTASLERPWAKRIHTRKLYTLLASGEITLDEFLDCIVAPQKAVEETLGESVANSLLEDYKKAYTLIISEGES